MTYLFSSFPGMVMGLIAAVPIGPVNLICIRRSFAFGPLNGFVSGLGAALGDGIFAAITGFGLTWIAQLIEGYATIIELIGGALLVWFGWRIFMRPADAALRGGAGDKGGTNLVRAMASTFALTITNPVTLLSFTVMFAGLGGWPAERAAISDAGFVVGGRGGRLDRLVAGPDHVIGLFHARMDERRHADHQPGLRRCWSWSAAWPCWSIWP